MQPLTPGLGRLTVKDVGISGFHVPPGVSLLCELQKLFLIS